MERMSYMTGFLRWEVWDCWKGFGTLTVGPRARGGDEYGACVGRCTVGAEDRA